MPKPILVANWKNAPGSLDGARFLLKSLSKKKLLYKKTALFIAPPLTYLEVVGEKAHSFAQLAVQDFFPKEKGRFTGSVTPEILKSFGVRLAILGHSERRALGETALEVSEKARVALRAGITPLICFGETTKDSEGEHFTFIQTELKTLLSGFKKPDLSKIMLAYEPAWAIGKSFKEAIEPQELSQNVLFIKKILSDLFDRKVANLVPILYGGSAEPANAGLLLRNSGISGLLVGHASLNAKSFEAMASAVLEK